MAFHECIEGTRTAKITVVSLGPVVQKNEFELLVKYVM